MNTRHQAPCAEQNWIFDNFIQLTDNEDILHPGIMGIRLERGFKFGDMERIFRRVTGRRAFPRAWAHGADRQREMDELTPPEDVHAWMDRLNCPKELWKYQDVFHPMGEVGSDIYSGIADWINDVLRDGLPIDHDVRREITP